MKGTIICFGVRDYEIPYFNKLGKQYNYDLVLRPEYLTNDCWELAKGYEIVMARGNCVVDYAHMKLLKDNGLKYYLTRTAGYNHVDLKACKDFGIESAFVPGYSPNAISELALSLAMALLRNVVYATDRTHHGDFTVTNQMFSREVRGCTVGVMGCGRIGCTTASLFKGLGATVIGYDVFQSDKAKAILTFEDLDSFLSKSDIVISHMAYVKGKNDGFISRDVIGKMKENAILINVARGEILDTQAAVDAVKSNHLAGLGLDVVTGEGTLFNHVFDPKHLDTPLHQEIVDLYPRVLITPHIGSATDLALIDMIEVSLKNMDSYRETGTCANSLIK
jgi:D-lactate dehydrogenase